ncbi:hypothetical protein [Acetobacter aceti]|uniref:Uncharacterized protein n=1 Tax=Acetobacter aceti TaxID=435 RepID=A0A6S6PLX4_ACEAC|nr:hypothetical protein [Acetobacter aceti]BCI68050.1 hypothetical protein AAJCM20276_26740 [Acetobacter aceti]
MKSKPIKISRDKKGNVRLALGREETILNADNLVELASACIALRSQIEPSMIADMEAPGNGATHETGMKWRVIKNDKPGIEIQIGHPGFGWFTLHLNPEQSDFFLKSYIGHTNSNQPMN